MPFSVMMAVMYLWGGDVEGGVGGGDALRRQADAADAGYLFGVSFFDGNFLAGFQREVDGAGGRCHIKRYAVFFSQHS